MRFFSPGARTPVKACFSPAAIHSMMAYGHGVAHPDDYELDPLEFTEESRQALEGDQGRYKTTPLSTLSHPQSPSTHSEIFHDHGTLEAISALNSLSNSPAKFLKKRPVNDAASSSDGGNNGQSGASQSLFAAVVGGVEKNESRKKRRK
jgi:hypothetical protein